MRKRYIYAFFIPIIVLLLSFLILGIYPFGDKSIIVIDSNTQYTEFITYFRSILLGNNNFLYTFSATLGQNFISLLGYYLMSPFNILSIFFKPYNMKLFMTIIILLKIGLCSLTMEIYISKTYKNVNILFSICYGLMMYNIMYMYHLMWLDSLIMFPLVVVGIDYIFNKKSPVLYIVSLGLSIIFNYYIGFIICITSLIYFIYKYLFNRDSINKFKVITDYIVSSLFGGLLSSFMLIPSVMGLQGGKASLSLFNLTFDKNISLFKVLAKTFVTSTGNGETWRGGPMIYCSVLVLMLVILYFLNRKIDKRDKLYSFGLIMVFVLSFIIKDFDTLFHGFNIPNCFDFRHAFVLVFFLINIAIKSYLSLDKSVFKKGICVLLVICLIVFLYRFKFNISTYNISIILTIIFSFIYIFLFKRNSKLIIYVLIIELLINSMGGILTNILSDKQYNSNYSNYVKNVSEVVDLIDDDSFYRVEKTFDRDSNNKFLNLNDSMIFNYSGISHFDSTSKEDVQVLMERLGARRLLTRAYYNDKGSTYLFDALFGIKYVLSYDDYKDYVLINKVNNIGIYENGYYLPISYVINDDNISLEKNPFVNLNNIVKSFSSLDKDIYNKADYSYIDNEYIINVESNDELYFYGEVIDSLDTNYGNAKIYLNGNYLCDYYTKYSNGIISLGKYSIGEVLRLKIVFDNEISIDDVDIYYEDMDVFKEHINILRENKLDIVKNSSSSITIKGKFDNSSLLFISIPYDEGFNCYIDGDEVDINNLISLISVNVPEGEHTIELSYSPRGLSLGIYISIISLILTIIYLVFWERLWELYYKYKEIFNYIIVGVFTTLISLVSYFIFSRIFDISNNFYFILCNTLSFILSVSFAYFTNKKYVFESRNKGFMEFIKFVFSRIVTYLIDLLLMFIIVKVILLNNDISKLIVQFIVFVLNYVFSKLIVFKK